MPVYNWFKVHNTGNLTYIRKNPKQEVEYSAGLDIMWEKLYDEFIDKYGFSEDFEQIIRLKKKYINQLCDYVLKDDRLKLSEAEFTRIEIEELVKQNPVLSDEESVILIEQELGFKLDTKKLSVVEYYNYLEYLGKKAKKQKEMANG